MEKVLKHIVYIIIVSFVLSCKAEKKRTTNSETEKLQSEVIDTAKTISQQSKFNTENPNCLKENDTIEVSKFKERLANAIVKKDTLEIVNFIQFEYMSNDISIENKKKELKSEIISIMQYCLKSVMDEYESEQLLGDEYFDEKDTSDGCWVYKISNNFPSLEFSHIFIFEKIDGEIKLVAIETIG